MATKKKGNKTKKDEYIQLDEMEAPEEPEEPTEAVKLEVFRSEEEEKRKNTNPFARAFNGVNVTLFIIAAVLVALAILERGRGLLDFIAAIVFILVMVKIMLDGYGINIMGGEQ